MVTLHTDNTVLSYIVRQIRMVNYCEILLAVASFWMVHMLAVAFTFICFVCICHL